MCGQRDGPVATSNNAEKVKQMSTRGILPWLAAGLALALSACGGAAGEKTIMEAGLVAADGTAEALSIEAAPAASQPPP